MEAVNKKIRTLLKITIHRLIRMNCDNGAKWMGKDLKTGKGESSSQVRILFPPLTATPCRHEAPVLKTGVSERVPQVPRHYNLARPPETQWRGILHPPLATYQSATRRLS